MKTLHLSVDGHLSEDGHYWAPTLCGTTDSPLHNRMDIQSWLTADLYPFRRCALCDADKDLLVLKELNI